MAKESKKDLQDYTVEEKLKSLYQLQLIFSEIDRIKTLRGELPLEVEDLDSCGSCHPRLPGNPTVEE